MSNKFHKVKVQDIYKTTKDCSVVTLDIPQEVRGSFDFKQGQYLTLKAMIDGEDVRRSYSLCSSPNDEMWQVGIKKIIDGKFSTYANDHLAVGDEIEVMAPAGNFYVDVDDSKATNYVAFAAGSGITPIYSIIKTHLESEPNATFKLFFTNKNAASVILKEELEALKNRFMDRLEIFHFLTKEIRGISLFDGRLSESKMDVIFKTLCDTNTIDHYFSCGPESMIMMIKDFLVAKGVDASVIHFELFNTAGASTEKKEALQQQFSGKRSTITVKEGGKQFLFDMEQGSDNILDVALQQAADLPFACKGGVCCTCKAKLVEGTVDMLLTYGLEPEEIDEGYVLTCQAIPTSEKVVVDFDI